MQAGCLTDPDTVLFWRTVILPNSYLSSREQVQVALELARGVSIRDYLCAGAVDKLKRLDTTPIYRPNKSMQSLVTITGLPMQEWMNAKYEEYKRTKAFVVVAPDFLKITSAVSVEPKKPRWISDLRPLNDFLETPPMRYDDLNSFRKELRRGDLLFTIDLAAGYNHVAVARDSLPYMGGKWGTEVFTCAALSFGCSISPFCFQRITKALGMLLTRLGMGVCVYLDDFCIRCIRGKEGDAVSQQRKADESIFLVRIIFFLANLYTHPVKCQWRYATVVRALGFFMDTDAMTFRLTEERRARLLSDAAALALRTDITIREMQVFAGVAVSLTLCCPVVKSFLVPLWEAIRKGSIRKGKRANICMSPKVTEALQQFTPENVDLWVRVGRWRPDAHVSVALTTAEVREVITIYSDAAGTAADPVENSRRGWGGVIHAAGQDTPRLLQGPFEGAERDYPIHLKECLAALFMLRCSGVRNAYVVLYTDNMSVYHSLRNFHSKDEEFGRTVRAVVMFCIENNVSLRVEWLSSAANAVADEQSRTIRSVEDRSDVMLHADIFTAAQAWALCVCDVDICATPANRMTHRFISRARWGVDGECGQDCMSADLGKLRRADGSLAWLWCHPPWDLISPMWSHLQHQRCRGLMVIPHFEKMPWFSRIMRDCVRCTVLAEVGDTNVLWALTSPPGSHRVCKGPMTVRVWCVLFNFE